MPPVKITFPRPGFSIPPSGVFVAIYHADETILGAVGTCTPKEDHGTPIPGMRLCFNRKTDKSGKAFNLGMIAFQLDAFKEYELKVVGVTESGLGPTDSVCVAASTKPSPRFFDIKIEYPAPGDDTCDLCNGAPAWGSLANADLAVDKVVLIDVDNTKIPPSSIGSTGPPIWAVQFPPITQPANAGDLSETYKLQVEDTSGNQDNVDVSHTFPCPGSCS